MQTQAVLLESLRKHYLHATSISFALEHHHEVVGKTRQMRRATQSRLHGVLKPKVEYTVKKDVREYRRYHPALRHSGFRVVETPFFHHAGIQPFANEAQCWFPHYLVIHRDGVPAV